MTTRLEAPLQVGPKPANEGESGSSLFRKSGPRAHGRSSPSGFASFFWGGEGGAFDYDPFGALFGIARNTGGCGSKFFYESVFKDLIFIEYAHSIGFSQKLLCNR